MPEVAYLRGRDTSGPLSEVRSVLSRAETAVVTIRNMEERLYAAAVISGRETFPWEERWEDPDTEDMITALSEVVDILDRWRRTGRSKK